LKGSRQVACVVTVSAFALKVEKPLKSAGLLAKKGTSPQRISSNSRTAPSRLLRITG
jgi:hypothetical protein